jgi:hypothetical protein
MANLLNIQRFKMKLQTARQDSDRQLLRIGGRQQELDVCRRLFQRFQQRIEAVAREHVDFIDQVNLETATRRGVLHVIEQIASIFHFGSGGGIDLDQIDKAPLLNLTAVITLATGRRGDACFAVQTFGQQPRNGGFTHAARAGEQIGVMDPPQREAISQRRQDMLLSDNLCKRLGAPLTGKNLIAH